MWQLNTHFQACKIIVPTESYRDEGFSYHYVPAGDYIKITNSAKLISLFASLGIPYVAGRSWTTDALYRETIENVIRRKADGCISVEMESSALQAVCTYKLINLYIFFFVSDLLNAELWKNVNLGTDEEKKEQLNAFGIALKVAQFIQNGK